VQDDGEYNIGMHPRTAMAAVLLGPVASFVAACRRHIEGEKTPPALAIATRAVVADEKPPLRTDGRFISLTMPGFLDAVAAVPQGVTSPRPIVVAAHGMWDPPEGLCDNWSWIVRDRAWVLCPRGEPNPDKTFRYRNAQRLSEEIEAGVHALAERYAGYVDDGPMVYTGFSLGAVYGPWILSHYPARFPRAVLTEGGEDGFSSELASSYFRGGGLRVLFACGLSSRVKGADGAAALLADAGVPSRVVLGKLPDAGQFMHWYNGPVAEETKAQFDWLVEGDERWSASEER
jgi:hypothetical protein